MDGVTTSASSDSDIESNYPTKIFERKFTAIFLTVSGLLVLTVGSLLLYRSGGAGPISAAPAQEEPVILRSAWSSRAEPFSYVNPTDIGFRSVDRPTSSKPGKILQNLIKKNDENEAPDTPLPTNSWFQNLILGDSNVSPENKVFQIPYIVDTAGYIAGVRSHPAHLEGNDKVVLMNFQPDNGLALGAAEKFLDQHFVHKHSHGTPATISKLAIELEWVTHEHDHDETRGDSEAHSTAAGPSMRSPIVRGCPYTSMKYLDATPRVYVQRKLSGPVLIDSGGSSTSRTKTLTCGDGLGNYSEEPVLVQRELKVQFDTSDFTWLIFVSEPTEFVCSQHVHDSSYDPPIIPGLPIENDPKMSSFFDLKATKPMHRGMVRVAMANNCTTGQNPIHCLNAKPSDQSDYEKLLRDHAEVYPTSKADIGFTFPVSSSEEEELRLAINWRPSTMSSLRLEIGDDDVDSQDAQIGMTIPHTELLMFALPHHQERLRPSVGSSNAVQKFGCQRNIHGVACPALGSTWSLVEHLHRTSFSAPRAPREEMVASIQAALKTDIHFTPPENYMSGAGDTYFSGKILAKLARIVLVANEVGGVPKKDFNSAVSTLRAGVEIWLNGSSLSPMLYDRAWGGIVMCGCLYTFENNKGGCSNKYPDCPALSDAGSNFGAGFYNDHHYHFGYHIYAAAVLAKFDPLWGRKFHQHVLMLVRDIVNPSDDDIYFPTWRHKDWYLGFSWASGIVTIGGKPWPNGRNQESASEAIAAYEAVALYGDTMAQIFDSSAVDEDAHKLETCLRIRDMGRLLMATEIRSTQTYWHVQAPDTPGVNRVYPEIYKPKVIGMMWSVLAQLQTWFGNEEWKSYGIQLMPLTPASELRDSGTWMAEMIPSLTASCLKDKSCLESGWAVLIYACLSSTGHWREAWQGLNSLQPEYFEDAGGNGHSLTNSLWYVATRPVVDEDEYNEDVDSSSADIANAFGGSSSGKVVKEVNVRKLLIDIAATGADAIVMQA